MKNSLALLAVTGLLLAGCRTSQPSLKECGLVIDRATGLITRAPGIEPTAVQKDHMENMRYGMFIHFGINTFVNKEWTDGSVSAATYAPKEIAADEWVLAAKNAGMSHVVLVCKHHDGFCNWPTKFTDYCVAHSGNTNDVVKAVSDACRKHGVQFAIYYSCWDRNWDARHAADYKKDREAANKVYTDYMVSQLEELMSQYGPVAELWLDGQWAKNPGDWHFDRVYDAIKRHQPACQIAVNHTICHPGKTPTPNNWSAYAKPWEQKEGDPIACFPSDFRLWDSYLPGANDPKVFSHDGQKFYMPFETTVRLNRDWFWNADDHELKSVNDLEKLYIQATSQNNLLLLNSPPGPDGHMRPETIKRLVELRERLDLQTNRCVRGKSSTP